MLEKANDEVLHSSDLPRPYQPVIKQQRSLDSVTVNDDETNDGVLHFSDSPQPVQPVIKQQRSLDSVTVVDEHNSVNKDDNADSDFPEGGLRAWLMVVAATCFVMATLGVVNSFIFQAYYSQTLLPDFSPSSLSWIGSIQYALSLFPGLFTGRLFDLGHFRLPMFIFSTTLVISVIMTGQCTQYWHFLLCQGFAFGISSGFLFGPSLSCVAHWFKRRRCLAYGIVATGSSIGGIVFPILVKNLLPRIGFPWTMRVIGLIVLVLTGFGNLVLRRRLPPVNVTGGLFNLKALKYPPFTIFVASGFFCFLGLYTVLTYIDSSAIFYGISPQLSFYLVAIANASSSIGRVMAGFLSQRFGPLNSLIPLTAAAGIFTMAWPYAKTPTTVIIIAILYGIFSGAYIGLLPLPVASMGDIGDLGRRQGMLLSLLSVGAIVGPPISGLINMVTHGYVATGYYAGSTVLVGVGLMVICRAMLTGHLVRGKI